jgi:hypothetical protein
VTLPQIAALALLWQSSLVVNIGAVARPEHLRYQRAVQVAAPGTGMACLALDVTVLAHTASPAHNDLRLFRSLPGEGESEVPYTLTESGPEPVADTAAVPEHVAVAGNRLSFDLRMPARPYSEIKLALRLQNFVATVSVEDPRAAPGSAGDLGRVAIFDLTGRHLGRWESLLLGEGSAPLLHVTLDVRTPEGAPFPGLTPAALQGAEVPPSRARQTRFVPTVSTQHLDQRGVLSVALLRVPAHVPVERVRFEFASASPASFAREVTVSARADRAPVTDTEALDAGLLQHLSLPSGDPRLYPILLHEDALDATLGATLARPATVLVAVNNDGRPPLPIRSVILEMRERRMCFFADRMARYMLRYGDPALAPPVYDETALTVPPVPLDVTLGAERTNPAFRTRPDGRRLMERFPELYWLLVLLSGGMIGGTALHHVQHRRS